MPEQNEHLVLATLVESPGALLCMFDVMNHPEFWGDKAIKGLPRMTHLWLVSTSYEKIDPQKTILPSLIADDFGSGLRRKLGKVNIKDTQTNDEHLQKAEILTRLVLHGEDWCRKRPGQRVFSVLIASGRKNMAAVLQQSATFFEVDNVLHVGFVQGDSKVETLVQVRENSHRHHPIRLSHHPSPWRELIGEGWKRTFGDRPLQPSEYPLNPEWCNTEHTNTEIVGLQVPDPKRLIENLDNAAKEKSVFAGRAFACGIEAQFPRHDLKPLIEQLSSEDKMLRTLHHYLNGLSSFIHYTANLKFTNLR